MSSVAYTSLFHLNQFNVCIVGIVLEKASAYILLDSLTSALSILHKCDNYISDSFLTAFLSIKA